MCAIYAPISGGAQGCRVQRHVNAPFCATCGVVIVAKCGSRRQRYCSLKCRDEARRRRNFHKIGRARYPRSGVPRSVGIPAENSAACSAQVTDRRVRIPWRRIVEIEVIAPHDWKCVTSADGVVGWVTQLRPSPLVQKADGQNHTTKFVPDEWAAGAPRRHDPKLEGTQK